MWAGALTQIARHDPATAVKWLGIAKEAGVDVGSFTARIAHSWGVNHPKEAMNWLLEQPEGEERSRATWDVATRWLKRNPEQMDEWINSIKEENWNDGLRAASLMTRVETKSYQVDWAALMTECKRFVTEGTEDGVQSWLLQRWLLVDAGGAEGWIKANPEEMSADFFSRSRSISPEVRKKVEDALAALPTNAS